MRKKKWNAEEGNGVFVGSFASVGFTLSFNLTHDTDRNEL